MEPGPELFWTGPRQNLVHRLVRHRLPVGSLVVDAAWRPGSPLASLAGDYPVVAVSAGTGGPAGPEGASGGGAGDEGEGLRASVRGRVGHLPLADGSVDAVLLLDVLERTGDDRAVLGEAARVLGSGGLLVVAAAHGPWLWSPRDVRAGHRRRYTADQLASSLIELGLVPEHVRFFQFLLLPLFAASRLRARRRRRSLPREEELPSWLDRSLAAVNRLETAAAGRVPWPTGSTVLALARKP